jgi:hypothetical protein
MSTNNIPNNLPSVDRLMQRIAAAEKTQQKEIRISIQEARELTLELSMITARMGKTIAEIRDMLVDIKNSGGSGSPTVVQLDGGGF